MPASPTPTRLPPSPQVPLKRMLLWAMLLGTALGSTQLLLVSGANRSLGLSDQLFVLGDSVILTVLGQVRSGLDWLGACLTGLRRV